MKLEGIIDLKSIDHYGRAGSSPAGATNIIDI